MPTYDNFVDQIYQILHDGASMKTMLVGSKLGFLTLTISPMVYATLPSTPFVKPPNPGSAPTILPKTTSIEKTNISYKFTLET